VAALLHGRISEVLKGTEEVRKKEAKEAARRHVRDCRRRLEAGFFS
jgi:hypothetical protein